VAKSRYLSSEEASVKERVFWLALTMVALGSMSGVAIGQDSSPVDMPLSEETRTRGPVAQAEEQQRALNEFRRRLSEMNRSVEDLSRIMQNLAREREKEEERRRNAPSIFIRDVPALIEKREPQTPLREW
jgi:TolA-binding protein